MTETEAIRSSYLQRALPADRISMTVGDAVAERPGMGVASRRADLSRNLPMAFPVGPHLRCDVHGPGIGARPRGDDAPVQRSSRPGCRA